MKKILFLFFVFAATVQLHAQYTDGIALKYCDSIEKGYGGTGATVITPYVVFKPIITQAYIGNKITHVNIGLKGNATNVYLYIKKSPKDATSAYKQKIGNLSTGWNDIVLTTPFEITGDSISIGYKASFSEDNPNGVGYASEHNTDADYIFWNTKSNWYTTNGSICIQAIVNGDKLPANEMALKSLSSEVAKYGANTTKLTGVIANRGTSAVSTYELKYTVDKDEAQTLTINKNIPTNQSDTFNIEVPSTEIGTHLIQLSLSTVNGKPDAYLPNDTLSATLKVRDKNFMRRVVAEEGTGTWCGWCPRGLVGLQLMKELYGEQFIPISIHGGDALEVESYKPLTGKMTGFPDCFVNRKIEGDPFDNIEGMIKQEIAIDNHVSYIMDATYSADTTQVTVVASMVADSKLENPNYYTAFAVVEDSVTGYVQTNYYHDNENGYMYGWEKKGEKVSDVVYNDLARGIFSSYTGDLCTPETMETGETYKYTYTFTLPSNVKDKKNVRIIGLLIDSSKGYIINAYDATPKVATGIHQVTATPAYAFKTSDSQLKVMLPCSKNTCSLVALYSPDGQLISSRTTNEASLSLSIAGLKGIYFVKINNGSNSQTIKVCL